MEELRRIAFFDIGELFDDDGRLKRVKRLSAEARAVLASVKVIRTNLVSGDRQRERLHEVKLWDKLKALEILARHFRLVEEGTTTVIVADRVLAILDAGRERNRLASLQYNPPRSCAGIAVPSRSIGDGGHDVLEWADRQ